VYVWGGGGGGSDHTLDTSCTCMSTGINSMHSSARRVFIYKKHQTARRGRGGGGVCVSVFAFNNDTMEGKSCDQSLDIFE
jgi:hypothetical protein